jgi:hypothetical protein
MANVEDDHEKVRDNTNQFNNPENINVSATRNRVVINRPVYTQKEFQNEFGIKSKEQHTPLKQRFVKFLRYFDPRNLIGIFTILNWVSEYNIKSDLIPDILSGLTVGVFHIPQAIAYGALTSLNPVFGIYTSFYTGLTYIIFATRY